MEQQVLHLVQGIISGGDPNQIQSQSSNLSEFLTQHEAAVPTVARLLAAPEVPGEGPAAAAGYTLLASALVTASNAFPSCIIPNETIAKLIAKSGSLQNVPAGKTLACAAAGHSLAGVARGEAQLEPTVGLEYWSNFLPQPNARAALAWYASALATWWHARNLAGMVAHLSRAEMALVTDALARVRPGLVAYLGGAIQQSLTSGSEHLLDEVTALRDWLQHQPPPLSEFSSQQVQQLVELVFQCMSLSAELFEASVDCMIELVYLSSSSPELSGIVLPRVLQLRDRVLLHDEAFAKLDDDTLLGFARLFVEVGESHIEQMGAGTPDALAVCAALLRISEHDEAELFSMQSNFWCDLVGHIAKEHRASYVPVYEALITHPLHKHMQLSEEFAELPRDLQDEVKQMRRGPFTSVLRAACQVVSPERVLHMVVGWAEAELAHPQVQQLWQPLEAALYCIRSAAHTVDMERSEEAGKALALLSRIPNVPLVQYTALLIAGRYAQWLAHRPEALGGLLTMIAEAILAPGSLDARDAAALAFKNVCRDCVHVLVPQAESLVRLGVQAWSLQPPLPTRDLIEVVEGVGAVLARCTPTQAEQAIVKLTQCAFDTMAQAITSPDVVRASEALCALVDGISSELHGEDDSLARRTQLVGPIVQASWPSLATGMCKADELIVESVCRTVRRCVYALTLEAAVESGWLAAVAGAVRQSLTQRFDPALLRLASYVVDRASGKPHLTEHEAVQSFTVQALEVAVARVQERCGTGSLDEIPEAITNYFRLAEHVALAWPALVVSSNPGGAMLDCSIAVLAQVQAPNPIRASFVYTHCLFSRMSHVSSDMQPQVQQQLCAMLAEAASPAVCSAVARLNTAGSAGEESYTRGEALATALLAGMAGRFPAGAEHDAAFTLDWWRRADGAGCVATVGRVLQVRLPNLDAVHKEAFVGAITHAADLGIGCFDFVSACRKRARWIF